MDDRRDTADTQTANTISADIQRALRRIAARHGLHAAETPVCVNERGVFASISLYRDEAIKVFEDLFEARARELGLDRSWLGISVYNPRTGRRLKVIGLDPDGGERCVRLTDARGETFFLSPAALRRLVASASGS